MDWFQNQLYDELEVRQRAIANWKRLRIVIVLLQVCGGRVDKKDFLVSSKIYREKKKETRYIKAFIAPYVINPMNRYKVFWDLSLGFVYLLSYLMDPFIFAQHFEPLSNDTVVEIQETVTWLMVIDIFISMVTGY